MKSKAVRHIAKTRRSSLPVIAKILAENLNAPGVSPYLVEAAEHETVGV